MSQIVGLVSLVLLLAFLAVLLALVTSSLRMLREGDAGAARGPLVVFSFLVFVVGVSIFTWARPMLTFGLTSVGTLPDWTGRSLGASPLSWLCLGPVAASFAAVIVSRGPRTWISENYLTMSVITLVIALAGGIVAFLLMVGGIWSIVAVVMLLAVVVGLGSQGMIFVPHLDDGPRVGESQLSALPRMAGGRARRNMYRGIGLLASAPGQLVRKEFAIVALVVIVVAAVALFYTNRPPEPTPKPTTLTFQAPPTSTVAATVVPPPTPTPQIAAFKVVNTDQQGVLLREQPSRNAKSLASVMEGAIVEPVDAETVEADGVTWRKVKYGTGSVAWASAQFLEPVYSYGVVKVTNTGGESVFLRTKPGKSGSPIGLLREGNELRIVGTDTQADGKTWRNVSDGKGTSGWVSSEFLSPTSR